MKLNTGHRYELRIQLSVCVALVSAFATLLGLAWPISSLAASLRFSRDCPDSCTWFARYHSGDEMDTVTAEVRARGSLLRIKDPGVGIFPAPDEHRQTASHCDIAVGMATCEASGPRPVIETWVLLGAGNDSFSGSLPVPRTGTGYAVTGGAGADLLQGSSGPDVLRGGSGDDTLSGDAGNDYLVGGKGSDTFRGGTGEDSVDYGSYATARGVAVSLDNRANDGTRTERDNVHSDVERVVATRGVDVLTGDARNNTLDGVAGADVVRGRGGDDRLRNDTIAFPRVHARARLYGGHGNDILLVANGHGGDLVSCGPGNDTVHMDPGDTSRHCEHVMVAG